MRLEVITSAVLLRPAGLMVNFFSQKYNIAQASVVVLITDYWMGIFECCT